MKWNEDKGWGFLVPTAPCPKNYWVEYRDLDQTPMGRVLTALRVGMVDQWADHPFGQIVDVGIGGGAFVEAMGCLGTDINGEAIAWLKARGELWGGESVSVMTFFDSIEHIEDPCLYLAKAKKHVFLSTPIYEDEAGVYRSKHYKPLEHCWYFTDHGIKEFMDDAGFFLLEQTRIEDDAGREGIGSYAFQRRV